MLVSIAIQRFGINRSYCTSTISFTLILPIEMQIILWGTIYVHDEHIDLIVFAIWFPVNLIMFLNALDVGQ